MFIVCESVAWGMEHVPFNTSLLRTIRYAFPDDAIRFYGEESHIGYIRQQIGAEFDRSIIWKSLTLPPRHAGFYRRISSDFKRVHFLLNKLDEHSTKHALVMSANRSTLWAIKSLVSSIHKDKKIQAIIHGDFYPLSFGRFAKRNFSPLYRISSMKTALKLTGDKRIQQVVLEESVRDSVVKKIPSLKNHLSVLDHPIPVDEYLREDNWLSLPIHFGFLGHVTHRKGFPLYLKVAADISKRFPGQVKFHVIGRVSERYKQPNPSEMTFLSDLPDTRRLDRSEFIRRLNQLHFVCMFFDEAYEYTASGVLLDCIAFGKPIIATRLTTFENLENRYGDIGYLCEPHEIVETISSMVKQNDSDRYKEQVSNLLRIKESRSPAALSIRYRELIEKLLNQPRLS
jgi:glycosyltransferase involved in cell wall biosynthesis